MRLIILSILFIVQGYCEGQDSPGVQDILVWEPGDDPDLENESDREAYRLKAYTVESGCSDVCGAKRVYSSESALMACVNVLPKKCSAVIRSRTRVKPIICLRDNQATLIVNLTVPTMNELEFSLTGVILSFNPALPMAEPFELTTVIGEQADDCTLSEPRPYFTIPHVVSHGQYVRLANLPKPEDSGAMQIITSQTPTSLKLDATHILTAVSAAQKTKSPLFELFALLLAMLAHHH